MVELEVYADTLFLINFVNHLWILSLVKRKFSVNGAWYRLWLGAMGCGILYVSQFFVLELLSNFFVTGVSDGNLSSKIANVGVAIAQRVVSGSNLSDWSIKIGYAAGIIGQVLLIAISAIWVCIILLPKRKRYLWKKIILTTFWYSFVIAGILRLLLEKWKLFTGKAVHFSLVLLGVFLCTQIGAYLIQREKLPGGKNICQVIIKSSGEKTRVQALIDTGNSLSEPLSKKPVCLLEEELLARLTLENPLFYRAIPFRSVGCKQGLLYGVEIPELTVFRQEECYVIRNVVCAGVPYKLSGRGRYRMILHPDMCTEEHLCE